MTLQEFLVWAANSGGAAMVVSFILERVPQFKDLAAETKRWVFFGASFAVTVIAYLVLTYVPQEVLLNMAPYFALFYSLFIANFGGSAFHLLDKEAKG